MIIMIKTATETPLMVRYVAAANMTGSPVILLEDGVYQAHKLVGLCDSLKIRQSDAEHRGVNADGAELISDSDIVALIEQHGKQVVL